MKKKMKGPQKNMPPKDMPAEHVMMSEAEHEKAMSGMMGKMNKKMGRK